MIDYDKILDNNCKCSEPCPLCGGDVYVFGTDCYPSDGISFECMNDKCQYEGNITCTVRVDCLRDAAKLAHDFISVNKA